MTDQHDPPPHILAQLDQANASVDHWVSFMVAAATNYLGKGTSPHDVATHMVATWVGMRELDLDALTPWHVAELKISAAAIVRLAELKRKGKG